MPRHTPRPGRRRPAARSLFGLQAAEVVDHVPDVRFGHLALVALHVELRACAFADDEIDLAVGGSAVPFVVGQVRGMRAFGRHRAVALRVGSVAEAAVLLKQLLARLDRVGRRGDRVLQFLSVGAAAGILRRHGHRDECGTDDCKHGQNGRGGQFHGDGFYNYFVTTMVTSSSATSAPSSARQRRTYVPGSLNETFTGSLPSAGIGGAVHCGAHGELAPARVSSHALTCGGSKVTFAPTGPRYTNHDT